MGKPQKSIIQGLERKKMSGFKQVTEEKEDKELTEEELQECRSIDIALTTLGLYINLTRFLFFPCL